MCVCDGSVIYMEQHMHTRTLPSTHKHTLSFGLSGAHFHVINDYNFLSHLYKTLVLDAKTQQFSTQLKVHPLSVSLSPVRSGQAEFNSTVTGCKRDTTYYFTAK